jgi:sugar phosphate isomerase/epimerase
LKIGMMNNPRMNLLSEIAFAHDHGFDFLDLTMEPKAALPQKINLAATKKALDDHHLPTMGHTAYYLPFASPYESLRQAALEEIRLTLPVFAELGASRVSVHPDKSIPFAMGGKGIVQKNIESFQEIEAMARPLGIQILIENMDQNFNTVDEFQEVFARLPNLGFHLDVGHANLNLGKNQTEPFLQAFHDRLAHVHLSDNFGKGGDLHLPLGAGNIDWKKVVSLLKGFGYDGTITLEIFSMERAYLLVSKEKLRDLWGK